MGEDDFGEALAGGLGSEFGAGVALLIEDGGFGGGGVGERDAGVDVADDDGRAAYILDETVGGGEAVHFFFGEGLDQDFFGGGEGLAIEADDVDGTVLVVALDGDVAELNGAGFGEEADGGLAGGGIDGEEPLSVIPGDFAGAAGDDFFVAIDVLPEVGGDGLGVVSKVRSTRPVKKVSGSKVEVAPGAVPPSTAWKSALWPSTMGVALSASRSSTERTSRRPVSPGLMSPRRYCRASAGDWPISPGIM